MAYTSRAAFGMSTVASSNSSSTALPVSARPAATAGGAGARSWDDLRREARRLEGDLDTKLAALAKLVGGGGGGWGTGGVGAASEATGLLTGDGEQLAATKAAEIESLLTRLADVNESMGGALSPGDGRAHTLARHRDILREFGAELRRTRSRALTSVDRAALMGNRGATGDPFSQIGAAGQLLRERATIGSATAAIDTVLSQAQATAAQLRTQGSFFDAMNDRLGALGSQFPMLGAVLTNIRRKRSKDTLVLAAVVTACITLTVLYWWNKA